MVFTGIEDIEDGFFYKFSEGDKASVGDMVIWNNQKIKSGGEILPATRATSIAFKNTKEEPGITIVNHIIKSPSWNENTVKRIKTRMELEKETGKDISMEDYDKIKEATTNMLRDYGLSWDTLTYSTMGPHHQGRTRLQNWKEKGSKHFY